MNNINEKYRRLRKEMLETQIKRRGIKNKIVLDAFSKVERHLFVPPKMYNEAYKDHPIPIGFEQTISQPYIVAFMTEQLSILKHHKVLEVGTGSAYQTAILCELAMQVYTIELIEDLAIRAEKILQKLNYNNFKLKIGDAHKGWTDFAPFDRIMVTCAPENIPEKLIEQLAENGKMIIPAGRRNSQKLLLIEKHNNTITEKKLLAVRFVPMKNS